MSLHLLRMLETRLEAAGIALQAESQRLLTRLQLQLLAAAAVFIAHLGRHRAAGDRAATEPARAGVVGGGRRFRDRRSLGAGQAPTAWSPAARSARCTGSSKR